MGFLQSHGRHGGRDGKAHLSVTPAGFVATRFDQMSDTAKREPSIEPPSERDATAYASAGVPLSERGGLDQLSRVEEKLARVEEKFARSEALLLRLEASFQ